MLGLFLLGIISKQTKNTEAIVAVIIGVIVIIWFSFSDKLSPELSFLKIALHKNMIIVVGTLTIFLSGLVLTKIKNYIKK
jgi:SSS family solute:Na+ symporter